MDLPAQYDHAAAQQKWYAFWEKNGYFHAEADETREPYTIVIPPPNVTGALHLGHALNNTLQDILVRMRRMQGYATLWMPGTDHAGIATQAVVEKRLLDNEKLSRHDLGREKLVARIWEWKDQYEAQIIGQLKQLGASCDWERTRFTLDPVCARAVRQWFFGLFKRSLIYRGKRLVNWDTYLQTAVSDDEVFHDPVKGHFWHFQYPIINPQPGEPTQVEIATTRPETMLGDTAVAVHPDPSGALDRAESELQEKLAAAPAKEKPAIAEQLQTLRARRTTHLPTLEKFRGMASEGRMVMLPLLNREIPLITDEWAKPELGTGCVKITPAHDANDYEVGLRRDLPAVNILNPDGTLNSNAGQYQGLTIKIARDRVVADLDDLELLGKIEDREIDLAHSDRSKTPIEPYLADQWFVRMDRLAQTAMDAVTDDRVKIIPERYAKGYLDWLSEKRDWPIGRQLWWGHQLPIWSRPMASKADLRKLTAQLDADPAVAGDSVAYQVEWNEEVQNEDGEGATVNGAEAFERPVATIHVCIGDDDEQIVNRMESLGFTRQEDVLDTWFSSALWPHSTLGWPEKSPDLDYFYPTSTLITSRDIITLWVARMVLAGQFNMGAAPFREVFIHPKILDGYGETMSKSKGNGVDPIDVIEKFGADALRFGLAYLTTETQDVRMPVEFECPHCNALVGQTKKNRTLPRIECPKCGEAFRTQWAREPEDEALARASVVSERFELGRNFANKLWNAARFVMMNLDGYEGASVADNELTIEDRWLLSRLATVTGEVTTELERFHFADAARALYGFAWDEFCSFYVEMTKPRLADDTCRPVAQRVLAHVLDALVRLLHPFMPFVTEEIWQRLGEVVPLREIEIGNAARDRDASDRGAGSERSTSDRDAASERNASDRDAASERNASDRDAASERNASDRDAASGPVASPSVMIAAWPTGDERHIDERIERQFAQFQSVLGAVREIRSRQNIPLREQVHFSVRCEPQIADLLEPMAPYFASMARAEATGWGKAVEPPELCASVTRRDAEVFVDVSEFLDIPAERSRLDKERDGLAVRIEGIEKKLANEKFTSRAPADVVQGERDRLATLAEQLRSVEAALSKLPAV